MRILHHWMLDPASRQVRLLLNEKKLHYELCEENPWLPREAFYALNVSGRPPVLVDSTTAGKRIIAESRAILEYIEEIHPNPPLLAPEPVERAEARRIAQWFDGKFADEVNAYLLYEKLEKGLSSLGPPDPAALREGKQALRSHLEYIEWLAERRNWLAGRYLSHGDLVAAAHFSCIDYLGDMPWDDFPAVKSWYQRLKSRPGFRALLKDKIPIAAPAAHYTNLDF